MTFAFGVGLMILGIVCKVFSQRGPRLYKKTLSFGEWGFLGLGSMAAVVGHVEIVFLKPIAGLIVFSTLVGTGGLIEVIDLSGPDPDLQRIKPILASMCQVALILTISTAALYVFRNFIQ